jgi:hypothetical protein
MRTAFHKAITQPQQQPRQVDKLFATHKHTYRPRPRRQSQHPGGGIDRSLGERRFNCGYFCIQESNQLAPVQLDLSPLCASVEAGYVQTATWNARRHPLLTCDFTGMARPPRIVYDVATVYAGILDVARLRAAQIQRHSTNHSSTRGCDQSLRAQPKQDSLSVVPG